MAIQPVEILVLYVPDSDVGGIYVNNQLVGSTKYTKISDVIAAIQANAKIKMIDNLLNLETIQCVIKVTHQK